MLSFPAQAVDDAMGGVDVNEIREDHQSRSLRQENTATWPEGDYCIMPGNSRMCPEGFRKNSVSLAVPIIFGPMEKYNDGTHEEPYIRLGNAGGFNLVLKEYDQAYALRLTACCKF
ncbi:hypothetical protein ANCCAN_27637 [Ancylostoma caninum]|uniref:Uncharacterized protein n=1 Tax=Ancylostoma caninum TaxID=29170 RepID=A0A368F3G7_ANCCA|nr:hypothetical protein ANCCAN_27637 [Ancylostoma caninum]